MTNYVLWILSLSLILSSSSNFLLMWPSGENNTTSPPLGKRKYCDEYVCVCVCLFVRRDISGTTRAIFTKFLYMLLMAVVQSSSGVVVICYVLSVVWMTSGFFSINGHIAVWILLETSILLKFTYLPESRTQFNLLLSRGIILSNYFDTNSKLK